MGKWYTVGFVEIMGQYVPVPTMVLFLRVWVWCGKIVPAVYPCTTLAANTQEEATQ